MMTFSASGREEHVQVPATVPGLTLYEWDGPPPKPVSGPRGRSAEGFPDYFRVADYPLQWAISIDSHLLSDANPVDWRKWFHRLAPSPRVARCRTSGCDLHRTADKHPDDDVVRIQGDRNRLSDHLEQIQRFSPEVIVDLILSSKEQARQLMSTSRDVA